MDLAAQQLSYDAENQLVQVDVPTSETVSVRFEPGWNFFALPVIPDNLSITAVFPAFSADFDQISRYNPDTNHFEDYVGNAKFDDFTSLEYGRGYEVYCTNPAGATLTLTGKAPTRSPASNLTNGSHLIGSSALTTQSTDWLLNGLVSGVDYDTLHRYDTTGGSLTSATEAKPAEAYFLHALRTTTWNPPLPKYVSTRLTYDAEGGRIKKTTASSSTTYVGEVYEKDASGTTKYVFAGDQLVAAKQASGSLRFYHPDHLGSTHVLTDGVGAQLARFSYSPFGEVVNQTGSVDVPHKFTGQRFDPETGLYFYNARYYDASLGRFLSADSIVQDPSAPQFLNRYSYVRNNPINRTDPTGHCEAVCQTIIFVATVIIGSLIGGGGEPDPSVPPGPIHPTEFDALQAPQLPTSYPGVAALPPVGATSIAPLEFFPKPYGVVDELSDVFSGVSTAQLFFSAPMLRALSWAGRTGQGFLAVGIAPIVSGLGTRQIILKAGTELARTFGTEAGQTTAEGGFFITQSALRRIGLKMGVSPEALQEALALRPPVNNPATRLGLVRVLKGIPAKIRPIAGGLGNEIVIRKPYRQFLKFLEQTLVKLR